MTSGQVSRRRFLAGVAGTMGAIALAPRAAAAALPSPARSGLDHIIVVTMENRSFDHLLGWLPGADGKQAGLTYTDRQGVAHSTHPLAPDFQGCGFEDPDHSYLSSRVAYDGGKCDGFLRAGKNDLYSIGYYTQRDLPFLGAAAPAWTVCDRYFASIMGPTMSNRMYLHAGRTDRTTDLPVPSSLPTIWDVLAARGISGRYYRNNFAFLALWGTKYRQITHSFADFLRDCRTGALPAVAYVDPAYTLPLFGVGNDDHPPADIRAGEWFLQQVYTAVTTSPAWSRTLLVITFDEWGGFFEHVPPVHAPDVNPLHSLRGFRVPTLLISPFARRGQVDHGVYDHASVLKLIEWRFGLPALSVRDRTARNLAAALDFSRRNLQAPTFRVPRFDKSAPCPK
ncbi:MAG TPA: alkaline phosphatase family protein [Gaiellaceae bacterium]|nr:alkaline phosphatase family protein [Gaiellaceae bacterium]